MNIVRRHLTVSRQAYFCIAISRAICSTFATFALFACTSVLHNLVCTSIPPLFYVQCDRKRRTAFYVFILKVILVIKKAQILQPCHSESLRLLTMSKGSHQVVFIHVCGSRCFEYFSNSNLRFLT